MKKRIGEVTVLNVLFAMLVIFIHISSNPVLVLDKQGLPYMVVMAFWRLSSFVVQGFIFLSGFKMFYSRKEKFEPGRFYIGKVKNILLPYILWVIIFYFYLRSRGFLPQQNHITAIIKHIFVGDLVGHFYFIPVIMQFYLLAPVWNLLEKRIKPATSIILALAVMLVCSAELKNFLYNDRLFTTYLFYFVAGIYAGARYDDFLGRIKKYRLHLALLFVLVAAANVLLTYISFSGIRQIASLEYIHIAYCICAIFFCYAAALRVTGIAENILIKNIDRASYYIYLVHPLFIFMIDGFMYQAGIVSVRYTYPLRAVFVYLLTLSLCIGYTKLKAQHKQ